MSGLDVVFYYFLNRKTKNNTILRDFFFISMRATHKLLYYTPVNLFRFLWVDSIKKKF